MEFFKCTDPNLWSHSISSYPSLIDSLNNPTLLSLHHFYSHDLPSLLHNRRPSPFITKSDLLSVLQWKLKRGKFRPRLLGYVSSLDDDAVKSASEKAFLSLPDLAKAVEELTVLKGVGPATASAVLAAFAPDVAPFMSDEAMEAVLGNSKDYSLKQYLLLATKLQAKAKELSSDKEQFTASDVERALWCSAIGAKLQDQPSNQKSQVNPKKAAGKKRKKSS